MIAATVPQVDFCRHTSKFLVKTFLSPGEAPADGQPFGSQSLASPSERSKQEIFHRRDLSEAIEVAPHVRPGFSTGSYRLVTLRVPEPDLSFHAVNMHSCRELSIPWQDVRVVLKWL